MTRTVLKPHSRPCGQSIHRPEAWSSVTLGEIGTPVRGGSPRPAGDPRFFNGDYVPWLTVASLTNVPNSQLEVYETQSFLTREGSLRSRTLYPGTLIIANSGATLGVAKILKIQCCANDGIAALLEIRSGISAGYLAHFINSQTERLRESVATGNGQPNLNTKLIGSIRIPLPPTLVEQEAIAGALSDADAWIESLESVVAKKRAVKQAVMQQLLTGKKRLPGFDAKWEARRLGDVGVFLKGSGVKKDEASSGEYPCVRYGELYTKHDDVIRQYTSHISADVAANATPLRAGDVLFAGSGETRDEIGKCAVFLGSEIAYGGGDIVILRPYSEPTAFLGYFLNSPPIQSQKASRGQGDAVVHISANALGSIECTLPSLNEQQRIAEVLLDIDDELKALRDKLVKARQIKQGMMQELLTGKTRLVKPEATA